MAGRGPEGYHQQIANAGADQQVVDAKPQDERSKTEKVTSFTKKLSAVQAGGWSVVAGVGLATANPVLAAVGGVGVAGNAAEIGGAHVIGKRAEKKRIEKQQLAEASNGKYRSAESVKHEKVSQTTMRPRKEYAAMTAQDLRRGGM